MTTLRKAFDYLGSFANYERTGLEGIKKEPDLSRLSSVLDELGNPHQDYRSVHIAGTKGKGSISTFTSSMLTASGYRTGLYTSPHLIAPSERIRVDSVPANDEIFVESVRCLKGVIDGRADESFSFFEVYTLAAILYFSLKRVDFAVFETGLGGRLDATNIIDADVCGISPLGYDHMDILGSKLEDIAREKAAIIKKGSCCVSSPQKKGVFGVLKERCDKVSAELLMVGRDIKFRVIEAGPEGTSVDIKSYMNLYRDCRIRLPGLFQAENCAAAIGICERLLEKDIDKEALMRGVSDAFIPGRLEVLGEAPLFIIDGAQNGESAATLKDSIEQIFKYDRLILLLGVSKDKDIKSICRELVPLSDEIILTKADVERAADPHMIRGYIRGRNVTVTSDIDEAMGIAFKKAGRNDLILATGSFFVIGEIREIFSRHR